MDLSIIIVSYNVKEFLHQAITSIVKACNNISYEIFVVDNASSDGSSELIKKNFPQIRLIENLDNKGFATANNQALKLATGEFVLLINPDTIVQEDTFSVIIDFFKKNPECGMLGCKILNPDGTLQLACRRSFPTPWVALTKIIGLSSLFPKSKLFGKYNLTYLDPEKTYEVEAISGSFMFLRKRVVEEVGMLDESFFMYGEDLDWCYRVGEAGWKIYYLPDTKIIHFKGESSKKSDIDLILQFYRAMNLFVGKHYQKRYFYFPQWFLLTGIWLRASLTFANKFLSRIWPGIVDFVLLNFSMLLGIYVGVYLRFDFFPWQSYLPVMLVYSIVWMGCIISTGSYFSKKFSSLRTIYGVSLGLMINTSLTFFFNQYAFSRAVVLIAGFLNILLLAGWRFNLKILARLDIFPFNHLLGHSLLGRKALIVAPIESGRKIAEKLGENYQTGYDVTGIVLPDEPGKNQETETGIPVLGTVKFLDKFIEQTRAKEVIFSIEQISFDRILEIIHHSKKQNIHFKLIPNSMDVIIGKASVEYIGDLPLVDINYRLNQSENIVIKRAFDVIFSMLAIFITLPEFLFIRIIKNEKIIKRKILTTDLNQVEILEFENQKLSRRQKRIPSLWSVLSGKISLVGSSIVYADKSNADHIDLKPGLTGMAQINKKNPEFLQDKKKYNHFYMKNYSIQLDFEIIIKTLFNI